MFCIWKRGKPCCFQKYELVVQQCCFCEKRTGPSSFLQHTISSIKEFLFSNNVSHLSKQIQADPNQNLKFVLAITLKVCISDSMLVKPKWVWGAYIYFENYKQTAENENKCQMHFDFTNMGQKCIFSEL